MDKHEPKEADWKWRYSILTGIMYGPIPVGLIFVTVLVVWFLVDWIIN